MVDIWNSLFFVLFLTGVCDPLRIYTGMKGGGGLTQVSRWAGHHISHFQSSQMNCNK